MKVIGWILTIVGGLGCIEGPMFICIAFSEGDETLAAIGVTQAIVGGIFCYLGIRLKRGKSKKSVASDHNLAPGEAIVIKDVSQAERVPASESQDPQIDDGVEYIVPEEPITPELLQDGTYLKRAVAICRRSSTTLNVARLLTILRSSTVWVPCNAIMSDVDYQALEAMVQAEQAGGDLDSLRGQEFTSQGTTRFVPDILKKGEAYFYPVFTTAEEMGEYGKRFTKIPMPFPKAVRMARSNERNVSGIVINAYSEPFEMNRELFDLVEDGDSE